MLAQKICVLAVTLGFPSEFMSVLCVLEQKYGFKSLAYVLFSETPKKETFIYCIKPIILIFQR